MRHYLLISKTGSLRIEIMRQTDKQAKQLAEKRASGALDYEIFRFDMRTDNENPWRKIGETVNGRLMSVR